MLPDFDVTADGLSGPKAIREAKMAELIQTLAPYLVRLQPVSIYILSFAGLLLGTAVLGGGIHVRDIQVPPLGLCSRVLTSIAAALSFGLFILITIADAGAALVQPKGELVFLHGKVLPPSVRLELFPAEPSATAEVTLTNGTGRFVFPKGIPEGTYNLVVSSTEKGVLGRVAVKAEHNVALKVIQNPDRDFISTTSTRVVEELFAKYRNERWQVQVAVIEQLGALALADTNVRDALRSRLDASSQADVSLAAFSLSHICSLQDDRSREAMRTMWHRSEENPFQRVRARATFRCVEAEKDAVKRDLLEVVIGRHDLVKGRNEAQAKGLAVTAAYFLATMRTKHTCVVTTLISALDSNSELARVKAREGLLTVSARTEASDRRADWEAWWAARPSGFTDCS